MASGPDAPLAAVAIPAARATRLLRAAAIVTLAVGLAWVVWWRRAWEAPPLLGALAAIAGLHAALHWLLPAFARRRAALAAYFAAQTALAVAFGVVSTSDPWTYQLLLVLLAEAVAVLRSQRAHVLAAAAQVAVAALAAVLLLERGTLVRALMHSVPMAVSIVAVGAMFVRQARAREEAQDALGALEAAHRRLVESAAEVERLTVASERQRLARELHDTLAQELAGVVLQLEALDAHLGRGDLAKATAIVEHARVRARAALADARTAIAGLRTSDLAPADAIREASERFSAATGIPCAISLPRGDVLPGDAAAHAVRFVAEGLSNVARHARASRASVSIAEAPDAVVVELADDGVGFDVAASESRPGHYGLLGMRERARLAGGRFEVESRPGAGTVLRLHLPRARGGVAA